jgi:large subunit ribosomal protein L17
MYRNMVTSLLDLERIETTDAKAKTVRRLADRMITLGKRGDLHARRRALRVIRSREVAAKVFDDLAERFRNRPGGYTRVIKVRNRVGDAAAMSIVELVESAATLEKAASAKKTSVAKKASAGKKAASAGEPKQRAKKKKSSARKTVADAGAKTAPKKTSKKAASTKKSTAKSASKKKTTKKAAAKKTSKKK